MRNQSGHATRSKNVDKFASIPTKYRKKRVTVGQSSTTHAPSSAHAGSPASQTFPFDDADSLSPRNAISPIWRLNLVEIALADQETIDDPYGSHEGTAFCINFNFLIFFRGFMGRDLQWNRVANGHKLELKPARAHSYHFRTVLHRRLTLSRKKFVSDQCNWGGCKKASSFDYEKLADMGQKRTLHNKV